MNLPARGFSSIIVFLLIIAVAGAVYFVYIKNQKSFEIQPEKSIKTSASKPSDFRWGRLTALSSEEGKKFNVVDNKVYYENHLIADADASTFMVGLYSTSTLYTTYVKDAKSVFATDCGIERCDYRLVSEAHSEDFVPVFDALGIPSDFGKDKIHVFLGSGKLDHADPTTFIALDDSLGHITEYGKDKQNVYIWEIGSGPIEGADASTFSADIPVPAYKSLGADVGSWGRDKDHVYLEGRVLEGLNPRTVTFVVDTNGIVMNQITDGTVTYRGAYKLPK
jgi:hypothetical protein